VNVEALGDVAADGVEDTFGFEGLAAADDAGERFVGADLEDFLCDDGAFVEVGSDEVGGDADDLDAALIGLAIGIRAGECGQERGVDVDDLVFPAPDEIGREDFHEAGEDDEIDFMLFEKIEDLAFGASTVLERDMVKRKLRFLGKGRERGAVADDDDRLCAECLGGFREKAFEDVGFLRHQQGEALRAGGREMDLGFHVEVAAGGGDGGLDFGAVEAGGSPGGLEGHAELPAGDLLFHGLDIGSELEEKLSDAGNNAGFVVSDEGDGREMLGHG